MKYRYFVSYMTPAGSAWCNVTTSSPITTSDCLREISNLIAEDLNVDEVAILFWRRWENEEEA